jgi:hypothetical protein
MGMKKMMIRLMMILATLVIVAGANAYTVTINDTAPNDGIGAEFQTESFSFTAMEVPFIIDIYTNYTLAGLTVGSWTTQPADILLDGASNGTGWDYAIPLVTHGIFNAGTIYSVTSLYMSDFFAPAGGGYIFNSNMPVWLKEGSSLGFAGNVADTDHGIKFQWDGGYWNDAGADYLTVGWATATCANDFISGGAPVPEPGTILLLGGGLLGLGFYSRKRMKA